MGGIDVRTATLADADAVHQILLASYPMLMAKAYDPELLRRALPLITRPNDRLLASGNYFLAEADGQPVGSGGWSHEIPGGTARAAGIAHIRHFAVSAAYVGRGVGRAIFNRCEAGARAEDIRLFKCFSSRNAVGFYASLGFKDCGEIEVPMPDGVKFPSVLMERPV